MQKMERETGFEPATFCLGSRCSTPELLPPSTDFNRLRPFLSILPQCLTGAPNRRTLSRNRGLT